jgi:tetratricopeptide (TPR) repeat protein
VASALNNLAAAEYDRGLWDRAREHYELGAQRAESVGDLILAATALNNMAEIHSDRGHLDRARPIFEEACHTWTSVDYRIGRGVALNNLGRLHRRSGSLDEAMAAFDEAHEIFRGIEATDFVAETWLRRAEVALAAGDPDQCLVDLRTATDSGSAVELGSPFLSAAHRLAAIAALHAEDHASFERELGAARKMTTGLRYEAALVLEVKVVIDVTTNRAGTAASRLTAAFDTLGVVDSGQRQMLPADPG